MPKIVCDEEHERRAKPFYLLKEDSVHTGLSLIPHLCHWWIR